MIKLYSVTYLSLSKKIYGGSKQLFRFESNWYRLNTRLSEMTDMKYDFFKTIMKEGKRTVYL